MLNEIKSFLSSYCSLFISFIPFLFVFFLLGITLQTHAEDITVYSKDTSSHDTNVYSEQEEYFFVNDEKIDTERLKELEHAGDSYTTREGTRFYKMYDDNYYYEKEDWYDK